MPNDITFQRGGSSFVIDTQLSNHMMFHFPRLTSETGTSTSHCRNGHVMNQSLCLAVLLQWTHQETRTGDNQQLSKEQEWTFAFVVSDVIRHLHDGEHAKSNRSLSLHLGEAGVWSAYLVSSWCQEHVESPCL